MFAEAAEDAIRMMLLEPTQAPASIAFDPYSSSGR